MKYSIDNDGSLYSGDENAEFPDGLTELSEKEYEKIVADNKQKMLDGEKEVQELYVKSIKDRYDRLVRNGWNEADARIESGLDQIEVK